jgi:preprotein translocase subunit SecA
MWRALSARSRRRPKLPKGLDAIWNGVAGRAASALPRSRLFLKRAEAVVALEEQYAPLSDAQLRKAALRFRELFRLGRERPEDVFDAIAIVREAGHRTLGLKFFPEQIAAALALHAGCVAELATGEGKTLAATAPAVIAGWRGRGCHVLTVNDYLAERDSNTMGSVYRFCGLKVAHIDQAMAPPERRAAYAADITYCTNKEVTADFLRDRLVLGPRQSLPAALLAKFAEGRGFGTDRLVMRGLDTAIVDEADSILIDEAVTPLIISGEAPNTEQIEAFALAAELAGNLEPQRDYRVDHRYREINLTRSGMARLEQLTRDAGGIWNGRRRRQELVSQALNARELFLRDKQYVIQDDKVVIVDEFTGRLMPDRTWRAGLHQAVEAKEGIEVESPKETLARISFQRFFRLYRNLSGMTGTAWEARHELWQIYSLPTVVLPTHRPCIRTSEPDHVFATVRAKWQAVVEEIRRVHAQGRPILVGTRSVEASEHLNRLLNDLGLRRQVLNAVRHAEEAAIVARAGQKGAITVATNMAGRGTDIKLGRGVAALGGLYVIATERHESGRIDRQLAGRAGRQGDPGSASTFVSLEDELLQRSTPHAARHLRRRYAANLGPIESRPVRAILSIAQARTERMALRQRRSVLRADDWLDEFLGFAGQET